MTDTLLQEQAKGTGAPAVEAYDALYGAQPTQKKCRDCGQVKDIKADFIHAYHNDCRLCTFRQGARLFRGAKQQFAKLCLAKEEQRLGLR